MSELSYISFQNVSFGFSGEAVLRDISFEAPAGKHTVIKGESGSGKSTLLKLLLGFLTPDQGQIIFNTGERDLKQIRKYTAWLPQDLDLGDGFVSDVMQNPFHFTANRGIPTDSFGNALDALGVSSTSLDKQYHDLSTGQRQRVGLATCHLLDKPLLLLDEPTSALDKAAKQKVADLILNSGRTVISTSHDPFWVRFADNVIELS